ncbi:MULTISPECIES: DALR anticodon-binding domain-containing protein [Actinoalloteichus]|uniref:arginine--tRNA ligase n=1 Tax=Actinoalloteichus fjordicus TaxID=1612552 RepID=A0AAC9PR47_9PSEU|nr:MULTISPECIES: arginine--tRNA ligase [Actinoalloteichus]APU13461.1 DALR anticodon binding domain/Arginyl tRNA synthetase N terminal domain [Actinoalloteichus fjordicus]APU19410.1 DALR anticodon binding domain/Arginyl tRNA synthetase N terminal domain [Actinoalloteichus sp. GBA129-24]
MSAEELAELVRVVAADVLSDRGLDVSLLPAPVVVRRRDAVSDTDGEYATTFALRAAGPVGLPARELAGLLADGLARAPGVRGAAAAGPGFVNIAIEQPTGPDVLHHVLLAGAGHGLPADGGLDLDAHADTVRVVDQAGVSVGAAERSTMVGAAAARYLVARARPHTSVRFDPERWRGRTDRNPLFRVQYAHARLTMLLRGAALLGVALPGSAERAAGHAEHADGRPEDVTLTRRLSEFPSVVADALPARPDRVARYLEDLADDVRRLADAGRLLPSGDERPSAEHAACALLCAASRQVLNNGLALLRMSAPERM